MSQVQNTSNYFTGIPEALFQAFFDLSPTERKISEMTATYFLDFVNDWHNWEKAVKALNIKLEPLHLNARSGEKVPAEKINVYQHAIETYYQGINDAFIHHLNLARDEMRGQDYDMNALETLLESLPEFRDQGPLSHAKYHQALRRFISANREADVFDLMLFGSLDNLSLLKMLLEEGTKPSTQELPIETNCDMDSLNWASLLTNIPDFPLKLDFSKLILKHGSIDTQGLTYLLWIACQYSYEDERSKGQQQESIKFLRSIGATWDIKLISDYPPILLTNGEGPLTFGSHQNQIKDMTDLKESP